MTCKWTKCHWLLSWQRILFAFHLNTIQLRDVTVLTSGGDVMCSSQLCHTTTTTPILSEYSFMAQCVEECIAATSCPSLSHSLVSPPHWHLFPSSSVLRKDLVYSRYAGSLTLLRGQTTLPAVYWRYSLFPSTARKNWQPSKWPWRACPCRPRLEVGDGEVLRWLRERERDDGGKVWQCDVSLI